jgi:hypothetical protein
VITAPELRSRPVGEIEAISDLEGRLVVVAGMKPNQPVPSADLRSLRSHLISDVDRPQERLIVVREDECASRVAISRGLVVQS